MSDTQHRVLKWGGIILGLASIVGMPTGFFLYLEDLRVSQRDRDAITTAAIVKVLNAIEISAESKRVLDEGWLELDQSGQVRLENQINGMLAALDTQSSATASLSASLAGVIRDQASQFQQREQRFEELETEHKLLLEAIYQTKADIALAIGRHEGRHETWNTLTK